MNNQNSSPPTKETVFMLKMLPQKQDNIPELEDLPGEFYR